MGDGDEAEARWPLSRSVGLGEVEERSGVEFGWTRGSPLGAEVPIDISGPRSRIINQCCNGYRSRSELYRDLIPQARAALGWPPRLGPLAKSGSPGRPTGRGCHRRGRLPTTKASLSGARRAARIRTHQAGSSASQPSLIRTPTLADRHVMDARSEPACSAIASPMGSFTERPG